MQDKIQRSISRQRDRRGVGRFSLFWNLSGDLFEGIWGAISER